MVAGLCIIGLSGTCGPGGGGKCFVRVCRWIGGSAVGRLWFLCEGMWTGRRGQELGGLDTADGVNECCKLGFGLQTRRVLHIASVVVRCNECWECFFF